MDRDRLERVTNTLLENITYFTVFESEGTDDIMIELHTIYDGIQHFGEAIGNNLDTTKRNACQKIAISIIEETS